MFLILPYQHALCALCFMLHALCLVPVLRELLPALEGLASRCLTNAWPSLNWYRTQTQCTTNALNNCEKSKDKKTYLGLGVGIYQNKRSICLASKRVSRKTPADRLLLEKSSLPALRRSVRAAQSDCLSRAEECRHAAGRPVRVLPLSLSAVPQATSRRSLPCPGVSRGSITCTHTHSARTHVNQCHTLAAAR